MQLNPETWENAESSLLSQIQGVCLDIDDTLSTHGKLTAEAFSALWRLKQAGFAVIPVTGRPAGWCDQIARFWPVDAVVGENGAFTFFMENGVRRRLETPAGERTPSENRARLSALGERILREFPFARWASDQSYREFDLAIDICEDVAPWSQRDVERLLQLCAEQGAHAKLSSIHVNTWFGDYDKRKGLEHWSRSAGISLDSFLFIGDSPNDEPLFGSFRWSVGVANLAKYLGRLKTPPRWMTQGESGQGFCQMVERLVQASRASSTTP